MSGGMRTIQVTEEEYQHLMRLREELQRRRAAGKGLDAIPGGRRSAEFGMGAVAGMAAYWLYQELFEEDEEGEDEFDERPVEVRPTAAPSHARPGRKRRMYR